MLLCTTCQRVNVPNLTCKLDHLPSWWEQVGRKSTPRGMIHLDDARQLPASASAGCPLCGLIVAAVLQNIENPTLVQTSTHSPSRDNKRALRDLERQLAADPIYLRPNYDPLKPSFPGDGAAGAWHVRGLKAFVPVDHGVLTGRIRLYAAKDSAAGVSYDVIGRASLPSSDSPQAYALMEDWMRTCMKKHEICKETLSGAAIDESTPPVLPTRIIHVGNPDAAIPPRLVETHGSRAFYVALSHCWGSPHSHRPLMTTQSTLTAHLTSISWSALPQTYRDAISATHRLGFEYIWIDSLCIVQDLHADWLGESKRMGDVYQHARLTIAASHAADSSQSCFVTRPSPQPAIQLPHVTASGTIEGSVFASLLPGDYIPISPDSGALAFRAWATQEWLLSRRMVFYTEGCLAWSCKAVSQRETGASFHATARNPRWKNIVEKYSARGLTRQTDRLIALDGVKAALAAKRPDDTYAFGLWRNSMPDQLLWYCLAPADRAKSELQLPTWTWAGTLHGVRFLDIRGEKNACSGFRVDEEKRELAIRGVLRRVQVARVSPSTNEEAAGVALFEDLLLSTVQEGMLYALYVDEGSVVGAGVLDEGVLITDTLYALRLMSKVPNAAAKRQKQKQNHSAKQFFEDSVLILQRRGENESGHVYERVGVGRIKTTAPWFGDAAPRFVCIT